MADLTESAQWEAGIYQLETTDEVKGGADGIDNLQAKQLANRTLYLKQQLESKPGVASQAEVDALTNDTKAVTPLKLGLGFDISLAENGYIVLPGWLGGLIFQWGNATATDKNNIPFNIAFPNACLNISLTEGTLASNSASSVAVLGVERDTITTSSFKVRTQAGSSAMKWFAIGH